jgi:ketosteroid isomerase-like protein
MSEENVNVVNHIYEAFGQGNIPAVLDSFDPTIEWVAAENSPAGDHSPYHGVNQVRDGVFARIAAGFEGFKIRVDELFDARDKVVMLGYYDGMYKETGKRFHAQVAHIWTIAAGRAIKFQQYTDTYQLAEATK